MRFYFLFLHIIFVHFFQPQIYAEKELVSSEHKIAVIGTGYVGLTAGACLAEFGNYVICCDIDEKKIKFLNEGGIPIFEKGLKELIDKNLALHRLEFTTDISQAIQNSEVILICVPTPMGQDGAADLSIVKSAVKTVAENLNNDKILLFKSTMPLGSIKRIQKLIQKQKKSAFNVEIAYLPEFLKEGTAVQDFFEPERIIIGTESKRLHQVIYDILAPLRIKNVPFCFTSFESAEIIKQASNSFLAVKISFINEIANLCDKTGADVREVAKGIGLDSRIGPEFLKPGPGYGGSCFPKDTHALLYEAQQLGVDLKVIQAAIEANDRQSKIVLEKLLKVLNSSIKDKTIAILGLAFKANTDDIRDSSAILIVNELLKRDAIIKAYDPIAMKNARKVLPQLVYCTSAEEAMYGADAVMILTEWEEFQKIDWSAVCNLMKTPIVIDARNILPIQMLRDLGFLYENIGCSHATGSDYE